jgi:uncharacterized protein
VVLRSGGVQGELHEPRVAPTGEALVLTHGAGSSREAPLLVAVATAFAARGVRVLRCDLPYRQARPSGPPRPGDAARDREGLRAAVAFLRAQGAGRVFLGGHSYGGRQASLLAAEEPAVAGALLLLSYPLHPPERPTELRTAHFPVIRIPALFVHGTRDPFGSLDELRAALALVPAPTTLHVVERAGHDLGGRRAALAATVAAALLTLAGRAR